MAISTEVANRLDRVLNQGELVSQVYERNPDYDYLMDLESFAREALQQIRKQTPPDNPQEIVPHLQNEIKLRITALECSLKIAEKELFDARNTIEYISSQRRIEELEEELEASRKNCNDLNNLLRSVGWGQGEIDSAAVVEEENEKLREALRECLRVVDDRWPILKPLLEAAKRNAREALKDG